MELTEMQKDLIFLLKNIGMQKEDVIAVMQILKTDDQIDSLITVMEEEPVMGRDEIIMRAALLVWNDESKGREWI